MRLYEGAKTSIRVDCELSGEFEVKVGMHQGHVLFHFIFVVVVDVVHELSREGVFNELLYADEFVLMSEAIEGLGSNSMKLKEDFDG